MMQRAIVMATFAGMLICASQPAAAQQSDPFRTAAPPAPVPIPAPQRPRPTPQEAVPAPPPPVPMFDGRYTGNTPPAGTCAAINFDVVVTQKVLFGGSTDGPNHWIVVGNISPDGGFVGSKSSGEVLNGRIQNGVFEADYASVNPKCGGVRHVMMRLTTRADPQSGPTPFDGRYTGGVPATTPCDAVTAEFIVTQGLIVGTGSGGKTNWQIRGFVTQDGTLTAMSGTQPLTGVFRNGSFTAVYPSTNLQCGQRTLTMQRAGPS